MGRRVIAALGIGTSATHMEWFFGPKGLKFSEIGCRPPGVGAWDLYSAGNDMDIYPDGRTRSSAARPAAAPSRRYASGMVALRPERDGSITGYSGRRGTAAAVRRVGHRRAPALAGHPDPAGGGRVHGQRLRADAPPGLRHAARDARHGGPHAARPRRSESDAAGAAAQAHAGGGRRVAVPGGADRHDHRRVAGARERRRRAEQAARLPRRQPRPVPALARRDRARPAVRRGRAQAGRSCSTSSRTATCSASTTRCRRSTRSSAAAATTSCAPSVLAEAIDAVRELDAAHLRRVGAVRGEFYARPAAARAPGDRRAPRRGGRPCSATPPRWWSPAGTWACWPTRCTCSTSRRRCARR